MNGIAASGGVAKIVQSIPLVAFYLATVGMAGFAIFKLKDSSVIWHKTLAVFMYILGAFITVAIPKASASLGKLTGINERLYVVAPLILLALTALVMALLENKKK